MHRGAISLIFARWLWGMFDGPEIWSAVFSAALIDCIINAEIRRKCSRKRSSASLEERVYIFERNISPDIHVEIYNESVLFWQNIYVVRVHFEGVLHSWPFPLYIYIYIYTTTSPYVILRESVTYYSVSQTKAQKFCGRESMPRANAIYSSACLYMR